MGIFNIFGRRAFFRHFWRRLCWGALAALLPFSAAASLPPEVRALMKKHRIAPERAGIVIRRADGAELVSHQPDRIFNPASLTKLPLAFAAFDILGADYTWRTAFARRGEIKNGVLEGDLIISGGGDPYITAERFLFFINDLRARGIHTISGDLIIDESLFALPPHVAGAFDGAAHKPYNAGGGALVVNFNAQRVAFLPQNGGVHIYTEPPNAHFIIDNQVRAGRTRCRNWRGRIGERYRNGEEGKLTLALRGRYSPRCGEQSFYTSALDGAANAAGVFAAMWRRMGGVWNGAWKVAPRPEDAVDIAVFDSPPLAWITAAMNKHSNNVIARNMFLSLAMEDGAPPYTLEDARAAFGKWMRGQNIGGDFYVDNGSGLSREGRMSAGQFAAVMENLRAHPFRAEIAASLPILGVDGTLQKRLRAAAGEGRLKTGSLRSVKNIAGFLRDAKGREIIFVCLLEKSGARAKQFQDALIRWARARP